MTLNLVVGVMVTLLTTTAAQSNQPSSPTLQTVTADKADKPLVLVGCVATDQGNAEQFILADEKGGVAYRLSGTNLHSYTGRRVQIVGGLYPSTNIAAQAGAIDPTKSAIAATEPETRAVQRPEFQVKQVRQLRGSCSPPSPK